MGNRGNNGGKVCVMDTDEPGEDPGSFKELRSIQWQVGAAGTQQDPARPSKTQQDPARCY